MTSLFSPCHGKMTRTMPRHHAHAALLLLMLVAVSTTASTAAGEQPNATSAVLGWRAQDWGQPPTDASDLATVLLYKFSSTKSSSLTPEEFSYFVACSLGQEECPDDETTVDGYRVLGMDDAMVLSGDNPEEEEGESATAVAVTDGGGDDTPFKLLSNCTSNRALSSLQCDAYTRCLSPSELLQLAAEAESSAAGAESGGRLLPLESVSVASLRKLLPLVVAQTQLQTCRGEIGYSSTEDPHGAPSQKPTPLEVWGYGLMFVTIISACSLVGVSVLPLMARQLYQQLLTALIGLAAGSLAASSLFHLMPQAFNMRAAYGNHDYLFTSLYVLLGLWAFLMIERIIKMCITAQARRKAEVRASASSHRIISAGEEDTPWSCSPDDLCGTEPSSPSKLAFIPQKNKMAAPVSQDGAISNASFCCNGGVPGTICGGYPAGGDICGGPVVVISGGGRSHHNNVVDDNKSLCCCLCLCCANNVCTCVGGASDVDGDCKVAKAYPFNNVDNSNDTSNTPGALSSSYSSTKNSPQMLKSSESVAAVADEKVNGQSDECLSNSNISGNPTPNRSLNTPSNIENAPNSSFKKKNNKNFAFTETEEEFITVVDVAKRRSGDDLTENSRNFNSGNSLHCQHNKPNPNSNCTTHKCKNCLNDTLCNKCSSNLRCRKNGTNNSSSNIHENNRCCSNHSANHKCNNCYNESNEYSSIARRCSNCQQLMPANRLAKTQGGSDNSSDEGRRGGGGGIGCIGGFPEKPDVEMIMASQQQAIRASFGHQQKPPAGVHNHQDVDYHPGESSVIRTVAWMIIFGDGFHNFLDGVSIGAAFSQNRMTGISISLAVMCEELPHELGDFAVLLNAGMSMRQALMYNFLSATTCYAGLVVGILLGEFTQDSTYIFALAGGMFLYISCVDMLPELNDVINTACEKGTTKDVLWLLFLQNVGMVLGVASLFFLAYYQDDIVFD